MIVNVEFYFLYYMEWGTVLISAIVSLMSAGGIGWIFTIREDRKTKKLENQKKEAEINEYKKDQIIQDWKDIAEEHKKRCNELKQDNLDKDNQIVKKDELISDLRTKLDDRNTYCAVAELMRCETISCEHRKPPFGMKESKINDSFIK